MKRKVLSVVLALLMCMMVVLPTFAEGEKETPPDRSHIALSFSLKHVSGSTYRMRASITNPANENIIANLILYDASYNYITSVSVSSSDYTISFGKYVILSSGTYHLELYCVADTLERSYERTYVI